MAGSKTHVGSPSSETCVAVLRRRCDAMRCTAGTGEVDSREMSWGIRRSHDDEGTRSREERIAS